MDFELSEEQLAVSELAAQIIGDRVTPERLGELGDAIDLDTWSELAKANLLGISLSEEMGGSDLGFLTTALILQEVGRKVAPLPVLATIVMGAMPIDAFGGTALRKEILPAVISGDMILSCALIEPGASPAAPMTVATRDGDGWRLDGLKICVPAGVDAHRILVPASTESGGVGVFVVDPSASGVKVTGQMTTTGYSEARLELSGVKVAGSAVLGDPESDPQRGAEIVGWIEERTIAGICMFTAGLCQESLRLTGEYAKTREQFDRPIGSFQAVAQRSADAYIDTEAVRLTALQAAWRLGSGMDSAKAVSIAKYWAAEGGQRVVAAAQHIHGGVGVDRDYPLHRYFLWAKSAELTLGGAAAHLQKVGVMLSQEPA